MLHKTGCISILSTVVLILLMEDATLTSACPKGLKRFKQAPRTNNLGSHKVMKNFNKAHKARLAENAAKAKAFKKTQKAKNLQNVGSAKAMKTFKDASKARDDANKASSKAFKTSQDSLHIVT
ncbi:hypothetical protein BOX15_Mlig016063g1 [Macrostomum lignano]|uniref:60S ribosomal protein L29 n=1 Tax=Macrostomum lignano TaxID=282301 RepID=A0A267EM70_9PLAT|nr:hypothetical protein BOX15_Mlig016063g3 [Macrostomum lignano]PAA88972.1 hypothetical protein BOX15_Mlig016063g1 [Macrostomum lignano]